MTLAIDNSDAAPRIQISGVRGTGREGIDERVFRFGLRMTFYPDFGEKQGPK